MSRLEKKIDKYMSAAGPLPSHLHLRAGGSLALARDHVGEAISNLRKCEQQGTRPTWIVGMDIDLAMRSLKKAKTALGWK